MQKYISYLAIIAELIRVDFKTFLTEYAGKIIDSIIWIVITMGITKYILPALGIPVGYSLIAYSGLLATSPLMESFPNAMGTAADLTGPRTINYDLLLPLPSWCILLQRACSFSLRSAAVCLFLLPLGKLFLWDELNLLTISWFKFTIIFVLTNIFSGVFSLFLGSTIKNLVTDHTWMRFVFPLWFLGGFQFTWYSLYAVSPIVAYIDLLNPFIHITEGTRAVLLGQEHYLPFWTCVAALCFFTLFFSYVTIIRIKKQLDFV